MSLLLTVLSVLAAWTLLGVLMIGLLMIFKTLEGARRYLEQIAMGVRAIEWQIHGIDHQAEKANTGLGESTQASRNAAEQFEELDRLLDAALPALRGR